MTDQRTATVIRVCASGHPAVTYIVKRNEPEPPCPVCSAKGKP